MEAKHINNEEQDPNGLCRLGPAFLEDYYRKIRQESRLFAGAFFYSTS